MGFKMNLQSIDYAVAQIEQLAQNPGVSDSLLFFLDRIEDLFPQVKIVFKRTYVKIFLSVPKAGEAKEQSTTPNDLFEKTVETAVETAVETVTVSDSPGVRLGFKGIGNEGDMGSGGDIRNGDMPDIIVTAGFEFEGSSKTILLIYLNLETFPGYRGQFQSEVLDYPIFGENYVVLGADGRDFMSRMSLQLAIAKAAMAIENTPAPATIGVLKEGEGRREEMGGIDEV